MKYYKDANDSLFGFELDGSQDHLIKDTYTPITQEELEALNARKFQARFDAMDYATKRQAAYPPLTDFADAWVKQDEAALEAYRAACLAVKAKYPK